MADAMEAMLLERFDGPHRFRRVQVPRPEPGPTEVLVKVTAVGTNPVEWNAGRDGWLATLHGGAPLRLGWDVCGQVVDVGYGVTRLRPGDEVFGLPLFPAPAGGYGQYVAAPSRHFTHRPESIGPVEAAGLPIAGLTAWQALIDTADVRPGQRVLVTAAAGGVGHLAVQIAKARGCHVIASASAAKHAFLRGLGADETFDYTAGSYHEIGPVDVVLDMVGEPTRTGLPQLLTHGGVLVSVADAVAPEVHQAAAARGATATEILVEPDLAGLSELAALVATGRLAVTVTAVFPLDQVDAAHQLGRTGRTKGKIVLTVGG